ncbi:MAG: putative aminoacrylate peracid reductase RutC [Bacteroidetes bacterium ADurb.Bin037]|nr:MAG: putative aminoacrylate peracid reductase RutC [Bacteroidetes bacterium ADurb.Bin037]
MEFLQHTFEKHPDCTVQVSVFRPVQGNGSQYHLIFRFQDPGKKDPRTNRPDPLTALHDCVEEWFMRDPYRDTECVFARYFMKDASTQRSHIRARELYPITCGVSFIEQPPANGSEIALWLYVRDKSCEDGKYTHLWITEKFCLAGDVTQQTRKLLTDYQQWLQAKGCHMADHCVRTWFFIRDIDVNYAAFAKSRTEYFSQIGMDENTHYIASTGIEGSNGVPSSYVTMDAYAIAGLEPSNIKFLYGFSHLSPTNMYGVTFERGVSLQFEDHDQILISGTASIDKSGNVLHMDNIHDQTLRMWENVEVLLEEAEATFEDVAQIIVYLRRQEDYEPVSNLFQSRFPAIPTVIVMGKVCRPAWLIEMECIALRSKKPAKSH